MTALQATRGGLGRFLLVLMVAAFSLFALPTAVGLAGAASTINKRVTVYYFHGSMRCESCLFIEVVAEGTLRAEFPGELASGTLLWCPLDVGLPKNSHFVADFGLASNELVVVLEQAGTNLSWEKIPDLWELAADPTRLSHRLRDVVVKSLDRKI